MNKPYIIFIDGQEIKTDDFIKNPSKYDVKNILLKFPILLYDINKIHVKDETYYTLIQQNNLDINMLPIHLRTDERCKNIIETSNFTLNTKIPVEYEKYLTLNICIKALRRNEFLIENIPKQFIDQEMCNFVFKASFNTFNLIPDKYKTYEMCCIVAVKKPELYLDKIPEHLKTHELYNFVYQNELSLKNIPKRFHTKDLYDKALKQDLFNGINHNIYYIFDANYLINNNLVKVENKQFNECVICYELKEYYFIYKCGHSVCSNCYKNTCYYNCNDIDLTILYKNDNFL